MQPENTPAAEARSENDGRAADEGFGYYELLPDPFHEAEAGVLGHSADREPGGEASREDASPPTPRGERGPGG